MPWSSSVFLNIAEDYFSGGRPELSAITPLPWPFGGLGDTQVAEFLRADRREREDIVQEALKLGQIYKLAIEEFSTLRRGFSDGATPAEALSSVSTEQLGAYEEAVLSQVDRGKGRYAVNSMSLENNLIATEIRYVKNKTSKTVTQKQGQFVDKAISNYQHQGASGMTQSRYLWHSRDDMTTVLIKPKERLHWTLDRAFSDADLVMAAAMSGIVSTEVA